MSFYRSGAFFWGIVVLAWLAYLYLGDNRVEKEDSFGAIYEQHQNDPVFMKSFKESITDEEENLDE